MYDGFEQLIQKHNVTAYRVAKEAGVTQTALSNWKSGRSTPSTPTLQKIADYFGVSVDYLMKGQEASILSYIDPLVAILVSVTFLHETITVFQVVGGGMILGITVVNEVRMRAGGGDPDPREELRP